MEVSKRAESVFCQIHLKVLIDANNSAQNVISPLLILSTVRLSPLAVIRVKESSTRAVDMGCRKIRILLKTVLPRDEDSEYMGDLMIPNTPYTF